MVEILQRFKMLPESIGVSNFGSFCVDWFTHALKRIVRIKRLAEMLLAKGQYRFEN